MVVSKVRRDVSLFLVWNLVIGETPATTSWFAILFEKVVNGTKYFKAVICIYYNLLNLLCVVYVLLKAHSVRSPD